ncbi:ABC transporter substrate-binding protein [Cohnella herbarum]|uniref:Carbohydrate ABC transporter substrate-binding protein n=1 Tax=Cohnella herbarum TaxID=2728023 RepID=A0A7Z2VR45_9BACL|nr:ABC transporter substrate-binding protein [Cohnella herbarum]QJD87390.1 carbohydrate ABC transporter substrate-binding protein [Cohnella herbarum]
MRKILSMLMVFVMGIALLSACGGGGGKSKDELAPLGKDEEAKIKVMFWDSNYFFQEYGNVFNFKFPNIEIEVVNMQSIYSENSTETMEERFDKFIEENKPDVLLLQGDQYEKYAQDGKLFPLDSVIEQDEFNLEGVHPAILKILREQGGGKLYGLTPEFSSAAIFYNIDLFNKHGVELPKDSMSWEEIFELAKRFPQNGDKDKRIYGLSTDTYLTVDNLIQTIGTAQDLRILNSDATDLNINTDSWKKVFQTTVDAAKSGALYVPKEEDRNYNFTSMEDMYKQNLFIMGRSAMAFKYSYEVQQIMQAKEQLKDVTPVNWGIVTAPVDPNNRNQSSYFNLGNTFAVSSNSGSTRAAWEFVKFVNSDEFAKMKSKSSNGNLLSRTEHNADKDGRSMEPFFKLEPKANTNSEYTKAPTSFFGAFSTLVKAEVDAVMADKKSVEEAVTTVQEKGREELIKAKEAAKKESPSPSASSSDSEASSSPSESAANP